jgi:hypothetical protein
MISHRQWRIWTTMVALALVLSLMLLLLTAGPAVACLILLPFFFLGLISLPALFARWDLLRLGHAPDAPALPASFQRPPPLLLP